MSCVMWQWLCIARARVHVKMEVRRLQVIGLKAELKKQCWCSRSCLLAPVTCCVFMCPFGSWLTEADCVWAYIVLCCWLPCYGKV